MKSQRTSLRSGIAEISAFLGRTVESVEKTPLSLSGFAATFTAIIVIRLLVENGINGFPSEGTDYVLYEASHTFLFFLFSFLLFLPIMRLAGASSWKRAANLLLVGFLIIWTPPVIDKAIFGDHAFWSFYELDGLPGLLSRFFRFFGDSPDIGITYGVRIEVALMSIGLGSYSFFRSRNVLRSIGILLLSYSVFFILGTFPSYIAIPALAARKGLLGVNGNDIAGFMLFPKRFLGTADIDPRMALGFRMSLVYAIFSVLSVGAFLFHSSKRIFLALLRNVRWPQVFWHTGLLLLGGGLAIVYAGGGMSPGLFEVLSGIVMIIAVTSAWLASVVGNDIADRRIDAITNPKRPIQTRDIPLPLYRDIGILFFATSILLSAIVSLKAALLLVAYQAVAWIYSMPPLRLKRIPFVATTLSAVAGMIILFAGYATLSPVPDLSPIPFSLLLFLFLCYTVTIPLKDFKDIEGDRADGIRTIPVIFGEKRARSAVGSALFLCYVLSPIALRDAGLLLPSFLFGSLAFLSVRRAGKDSLGFGTLRALPAWNMFLVIVYGFVALLFLFS
jgi:chlorophyll synthase